MKKLIALLGLAGNATEAQYVDAVQAILDDKVNLSKTLNVVQAENEGLKLEADRLSKELNDVRPLLGKLEEEIKTLEAGSAGGQQLEQLRKDLNDRENLLRLAADENQKLKDRLQQLGEQSRQALSDKSGGISDKDPDVVAKVGAGLSLSQAIEVVRNQRKEDAENAAKAALKK